MVRVCMCVGGMGFAIGVQMSDASVVGVGSDWK